MVLTTNLATHITTTTTLTTTTATEAGGTSADARRAQGLRPGAEAALLEKLMFK
ncbi:hypothetical protein D3C87_2059380 [compost metagenome]